MSRTTAGGRRIPILMYHEVTPRPHPAFLKYSITPGTFARQMRWLALAGYRTIGLDTLLDYRSGTADLPPRPIAITFDDGFRDCVEYTLPVLQARGFTATYFVVTGLVGGSARWLRSDLGIEPPMLTWDDARRLAAAGCECGAHTVSHPRLPALSTADCRDELLASRRALEDRLGYAVRHMAYPFGLYDERVRGLVAEAGYRSARSSRPGLSPSDDDPLALHQVPVKGGDSFLDFVVRLRTAETGRRMLRRKAGAIARRLRAWRASA